MTKQQRETETRISELLENYDTFEDFLEDFDITTVDAVFVLFDTGLLEPVRFGELLGMNLEEEDFE